jgi:hypothetical protein
VQLEGLGKLKKIHLIGTQTRDLPACGIVPQPKKATEFVFPVFRKDNIAFYYKEPSRTVCH